MSPTASTWCRLHGRLDDDPEHCPRCQGYWHSDIPCPVASATDSGGPMPGQPAPGENDLAKLRAFWARQKR